MYRLINLSINGTLKLNVTYFYLRQPDFVIINSSGSNEKKAYLYFTHSEAVNTMLPVFGLYRDPEPLTADMWPSDSHLWQTSKMLAFSHNIALVGLECPEREERFNIQVIYNGEHNGWCLDF